MRTCLFFLLLSLSSVALAQELPDSGLPDGAVDTGSAEGTSEENDPQGGPCLTTKDCGQHFSCDGARCVPVKVKSVGCSAAPELLLGAAALAALLRRRSQR